MYSQYGFRTKKKGHYKMISEKELILSDPKICAVLRKEAKKANVSLEEYVDRFLEVFYKENYKLPYLPQTERQSCKSPV